MTAVDPNRAVGLAHGPHWWVGVLMFLALVALVIVPGVVMALRGSR